MSDLVEYFLQRHGPCLSSDVTKYLAHADSISPEAARKRVSRLLQKPQKGTVRHLNHLTFPHRAQFLYLEHQFGTPLYWEKLIDSLMHSNTAYGNAIAALKRHDGVVPEELFPIICGAPTKLKKHLSPEVIFNRLNQAGLLERVTLPSIGNCITLARRGYTYDQICSKLSTKLIIENLLLSLVGNWLKNLGIVSYKKVSIRNKNDEKPSVGPFLWDLTAPSYLGAMVKNGNDGKANPGFVVCDIDLNHSITAEGIKPFINKCQTLRSLSKIAPCLQIFIAESFKEEAFLLLKKNGIIPATPKSLFGKDVAEGFSELSLVLKQAITSATVDPSKFDDLFKKFGKIEGASMQLRGTLFEYLSSAIMRKHNAHNIRMNQIYKVDKLRAEADVVAEKECISITFIECKGHSPYGETPHEEVKRWLQHNVPTLFKATKQNPNWSNLSLRFEFWTTAPLSQESLDFLSKGKKDINANRYTIHWRTGDDILKLCQETKDKGLISAYKKHFMKNGENASKSKNVEPIWAK